MKKLILSLAASSLCLSAAYADVVVIGNLNAAVLTKEQVADIFLGKDQSLTPLDQPESAAIRADFYKKTTDRNLQQVKAIWSRLVFSGRGQPPKELQDAAAVKKAVAADPKAVGYINKADIDGTVKVVFVCP
jgi:ABC-type phosphate transport system substrate-binding protein